LPNTGPSLCGHCQTTNTANQEGKIWDWNQECQESFDRLKSKLSSTPVLAFPDFKIPFILTTDASTVGLGAVLSQAQKGIDSPVSFASRQLNKA